VRLVVGALALALALLAPDGYGDGYGDGSGSGDGSGYGSGYGSGSGSGYGSGYGYGSGSVLSARACGFALEVHSIDRIALGCQVHSLTAWKRNYKRIARSHAIPTDAAANALLFVESLFSAA
jgi:hypothetical protein